VLSAIMASSCCWLPPVLIVMGVSGAGMTRALEQYRPVFMAVTFSFLGAAFYFTYRPRRVAVAAAGLPSGVEDCCAPAPPRRWRFSMMAMNKAMLWAVTALAVAFLFCPQYFTRLFGGGNEQITADMNRLMVKLEGMTCEG
jgi:hypothetical protein